jgi:murein DD-endopeptidase MepM/ murein hydrolase activator NlpD
MKAARPQAPRLSRVGTLLRRIGGRPWIALVLGCLLAVSVVDSAAATRSRAKSPPKPKGITHIVAQGQTLFRISQTYGLPVASLAEANRLKPSQPLKVGQRLFVPGATAVKPVEASRPLTAAERAVLETSLREELMLPPPSPPEPKRPRVKTDADFVWPIRGQINSPFGPRNSRLHAGIDIGSPNYQEVVAAADAEVIYANDTRGPLGKAVVLQHGRGMRTVYAHLSIIIAHERDTVRQGQAIGGVGDTGRATGPHLHFEIRQNGVPLNPEDYLPATIDELVRDLSTPR